MNKIKVHTVEQPNSDTTTFVLSCNRLDVLDRTLKSFYATRDYITKMVIVDDSAEEGVFETLVERYGTDCDIICFPRNRSQWWAMDFMVSFCDSEYIFYLEDDWQFLQSGYLNQSKDILKRYRDIGTIDISWRTFEEQGFETYDKTLIDNQFYYKKLWRISDNHYHWYGWVGSPNLKRRDDLILLGRVEKWHNEWNIDRRFLGLGLKSVYLNGRYVIHLGDHCSKMEGKRPSDATTPESFYPEELKKNRRYPVFDYLQWDTHCVNPEDITIVTAMLDIGRTDRNFNDHYLTSLQNLLSSRHPIVIYCESKYFDQISQIRGNQHLELKEINLDTISKEYLFNKVESIVSNPSWYNQSEWMKTSIIKSPHYVTLTLLKQFILRKVATTSNGKYFYWIDAGMFSSYKINSNINEFYLNRIPKEKFLITSFPYYSDSEIHGYDINVMTQECGVKPSYVSRATVFGGTIEQICKVSEVYQEEIELSLNRGVIGTEEAIYTKLCLKYPELFNRVEMPNGDISNFLNSIK